ncbi:type II toxin-antitoxin system VapC family toxin [Phycicoccus sp. HDW14]|uniref:type II toxin-antitoxin system VapC family toxin n=1 Tax=Phycicoccus sp. HDW14 TaxID=2714941 RepID=UPI00140DE79C|nr:type II toxin-antitoxin system VapC family toxin [Phycicoccus sp. HDW14]QIM20603.1 type II toxin-antitoxin system VapC family toxin [Phycicoccus sp. HDW14]
MIVDSSALVAIIGREPERDVFIAAIRSAERALMSAGSLLEAGIVVDARRSPEVSRMLDDVVRDLRIDVVAVTEAHVALGRAAYRDYGRGSGHPAGLNFGDCFAYALARETGDPLLFKGDDFVHTDLTSAVLR